MDSRRPLWSNPKKQITSKIGTSQRPLCWFSTCNRPTSKIVVKPGTNRRLKCNCTLLHEEQFYFPQSKNEQYKTVKNFAVELFTFSSSYIIWVLVRRSCENQSVIIAFIYSFWCHLPYHFNVTTFPPLSVETITYVIHILNAPKFLAFNFNH